MREPWEPLTPDRCGECGRYTPGWYEARDADIADAYESGISSRRLAGAYGLSEERVREILIQELGRRAYLTTWHLEVADEPTA